jgi:hypothetical protein
VSQLRMENDFSGYSFLAGFGIERFFGDLWLVLLKGYQNEK